MTSVFSVYRVLSASVFFLAAGVARWFGTGLVELCVCCSFYALADTVITTDV